MPDNLRRRARLAVRRFDHGQPLRKPDTLPILLFVLALISALMAMAPRQTHALVVDLPPPYPPGLIAPLSPPHDRLSIDRDGRPVGKRTRVSEPELRAILAARRTRGGGGALLFAPDGETRYGDAVMTLALVQRAGLVDPCFRFAGIARYRHYDRPETFADPATGDIAICAPFREG